MYILTVATIGVALYGEKNRRKAVKKGRKQQLEDEKSARKAEVFAETEGEGVGDTGQISLELDDELDDENVSNLSI